MGFYTKYGEWQIFEAVQPVKLTPLARWVTRGQGQHFVVKRLRDAATALTPAALASLRAAGQPLLGRGYNLAFNWSDKQICYSELIWKVYDRGLHRQLGQLHRLRDFNLGHPAVQGTLRRATAVIGARHFAGQYLPQPRPSNGGEPVK